MPNKEPGIQDNLKTPLHFFGTTTVSNKIVNVNKKKNNEKGSTGTGGVIGIEKNPNLLTGIKFGDKIIAESEKLDGEKEQEAKGGYNNYLRNRSQSDNARIAAKSKFKLAKREKRQGEKAAKWNEKTSALKGDMIGGVSQDEADRIVSNSPAVYSVANPFSPNQQDLIGQVYNPNGNDINQFQDGQAFNKSASNPNTLNEPPIPTEADTTMNDLQMGNEPMGAVFGENLPGALNPRQQRKADRRSRRADRRANRQGGFQNFVRQSVGGALTGIMPR